MIKGSIKNMTTADWREHYREHFSDLFKDYQRLRDVQHRRELSSSEMAQMRVITAMIDEKLA